MFPQFAAKGPWQTALVASSTLTLAAIVPPVVWFSAAAISLYVMRHGWRAGLLACALSVAAAALFHAMALGRFLPGGAWFGVYSAAVFWSPVFVVALVLRATESLELATLASFGLAVLVVFGVYLIVDSPRELWTEYLGRFVIAATQDSDADAVRDSVNTLARFGTGMLASGVLMNTLIGVFMGRSWQARLYEPGGFRTAFHAFWLPLWVRFALAALVALAWLTGADLVIAFALPAAVVLLVQGLAVVHGVVGIRQMGLGWLVALYIALMLLYTVVLIGMVAVVDGLVDFRGRARARRNTEN